MKFITPVNSAGLPIAWQTFSQTGQENCTNFNCFEIAKLYWKLKGIQVTYKFSYKHNKNSELIEGSIEAGCVSPPHTRILGPPTFFKEEENAHYFAKLHLDLYNINHHEPYNKHFCFNLDFDILESKNSFYTLSLHPNLPFYYLKSTHTFYFMNKPLIAYLYNKIPDTEGIIHYINCNLCFF